jgi:hypothetical protein
MVVTQAIQDYILSNSGGHLRQVVDYIARQSQQPMPTPYEEDYQQGEQVELEMRAAESVA